MDHYSSHCRKSRWIITAELFQYLLLAAEGDLFVGHRLPIFIQDLRKIEEFDTGTPFATVGTGDIRKKSADFGKVMALWMVDNNDQELSQLG
jgi:hypothetical protein